MAAASTSPATPGRRRALVRKLTFWLRPDFVLRCLRDFQAIFGFDRAIALASLAFTALIPLGIVTGAALPSADLGQRVVERLGLEGDGAKAMQDLLDSGQSVQSSFSLFGLFMVVVAVLSFARATQRLFESVWKLPPLSIRNTLNGLRWIGGLVVYLGVAGAIRSLSLGWALELVVSLALLAAGAQFVAWSGHVLTSRRVPRHMLVPGAILTMAVLAVYSLASSVYVPDLFNGYATRYGAIGVTFALISWLFALMFCLVASTVVGQQVYRELEAIRRGDAVSTAQIDAEWSELREQLAEGRAEAARRHDAWRARRAARRRKA